MEERDYSLTFGFIGEIEDMYNELRYLRKEVVRLQGIEKQFNDSVQESIKNSHEMMGNWLNVLTSGKISINP